MYTVKDDNSTTISEMAFFIILSNRKLLRRRRGLVRQCARFVFFDAFLIFLITQAEEELKYKQAAIIVGIIKVPKRIPFLAAKVCATFGI